MNIGNWNVQDQVRTLSQVGTKKTSKGGWIILELSEPCSNRYLSFPVRVIKKLETELVQLVQASF